MKAALVLAALLAVTPTHAGDTKESPQAGADRARFSSLICELSVQKS